jgi:hypothetical protein
MHITFYFKNDPRMPSHETNTHTMTQLGMPWSSQDQGMTLKTLDKPLTLP